MVAVASCWRLPAGAQAPDGRWVRLAPYPQPTQEIGGAVAGGKLYILGAYGANAPGGLAGWFNEYDPATDKWTKKPDIPMPVHHQAMVGYNGKVYVFGGGIKPTPTGDNWFPTNRSWEFTPATNTWREIAAMPTKRGGGFATELGGKIYVIGGAGYHPDQKEDVSISATVPHRSVGTNEVYDPATDTLGNAHADERAAQPPCRRRRERKDLRHWRARGLVVRRLEQRGHRRGVRPGHRPVARADADDLSAQRDGVWHRRTADLHGRRRVPRYRDGRRLPQLRGIRPGARSLVFAASDVGPAARLCRRHRRQPVPRRERPAAERHRRRRSRRHRSARSLRVDRAPGATSSR